MNRAAVRGAASHALRPGFGISLNLFYFNARRSA